MFIKIILFLWLHIIQTGMKVPRCLRLRIFQIMLNYNVDYVTIFTCHDKRSVNRIFIAQGMLLFPLKIVI